MGDGIAGVDGRMDKRISRTKRAVRDALLELMREKAFEKITVKEICDRADINRNTFYYHYATTQDLFDEVTDRFIQEVLAAQQLCDDVYDGILAVCEVYKRNDKLLSVVLQERFNVAFYFRLCDAETEITEKRLMKTNRWLDPELLRMLSVYMIHSGIGLLSTWVAQGMRRDSTEIARLLSDSLQKGILPTVTQFRPTDPPPGKLDPIFTNVQHILKEKFDI